VTTEHATGAPPSLEDPPDGSGASAEAAPVSCLNCGTPVTRQYCAECGQRAVDPDPTLRELLHEVAGELLHWDGKLWETLRLLVRHPGVLTVEYLAGRRARYVSPLKLYLTASVVYFFVSAIGPSASGKPLIQFGASDSAAISAGPSSGARGQIVAPVNVSAADTASRGLQGVIARLGTRASAGMRKAAKEQGEFTTQLRGRVGTLVFVILPAFAFAVGLAYRQQRRRFPQHFVFALHVHAVVFCVFALTSLAEFIERNAVRSTIDVLALVGLAAYLAMALRRVYPESWTRTVLKMVLLFIVYLSFFLAGMAVLVLYGFLTF
jgi:hypothetical protein